MKPERSAVTVLSALTVLGCFLLPAQAADNAPGGVQWTQMQDLDPTKTSNNRPIKDKWAVVIGASKFLAKRLNTPQEFDVAARNFYNYLIDPNGGRFQKSHVKLLVNSDATSRNIQSALGDGYLSKVGTPDDLVVVFVAARAFPTTDANTYLCAYDAAMGDIPGSCVSVNQITNLLQKIQSKRVVLILEASGSGAAEASQGAKALTTPRQNVDLDNLKLGDGYIVLSSSGKNEVTWGTEFSKNLIAALRENNGLTSLQTAFATAKTATEKTTASDINRANKQSPQIRWQWKGNDLVIGAPPTASSESGLQSVMAAEAHYLKAIQALQSGNVSLAQAEFEAALKDDPFYADAIADYGGLFYMQGLYDKAAEKFAQAIDARPDDILNRLNYARVLSKLNKKDESLKELLKAYEINSKAKDVLTALADTMSKRDETEKSLQYLNEALAVSPNDPDLYTRIGVILCKQGDINSAIEHAQKAISIDSKCAKAYLTLGNFYLGIKETDKAVETYRNGLMVEPNNADFHLYLGQALAAKNQETEAAAEYKMFLELCSSNDPRAEDTRKRLSDLGKI